MKSAIMTNCHTRQKECLDLVEYLINETDFFVAPASTQYHGAHKHGLVQHSFRIYQRMMTEVRNEMLMMGQEMSKELEESITIVSLFHDICKANTYEVYQRNVKNDVTGVWEKVDAYKFEEHFSLGHGAKSMFLVQSFVKLSVEEAQAIYYHMGLADLSYNEKLGCSGCFKHNKLALLLHIADMKASWIDEEN